jgi:hypothetical protein
MSTEPKNKPVTNIQVGGVQIPIWENEGKDGLYYKAGAPELRYRDAAGEWHTGKSYGPRDLVNLAKAAMLAHSEIGRLSHQDEGEQEAA